jgi:hypothetical protein
MFETVPDVTPLSTGGQGMEPIKLPSDDLPNQVQKRHPLCTFAKSINGKIGMLEAEFCQSLGDGRTSSRKLFHQ